MSIFAETFSALMNFPDSPTQQELSEASGVDRTTISRYLSGARFPVVEQITKLVCNVSTDRNRRLELLRAYLMDIASRCHTAGFDERHYSIEVDGGKNFDLGDNFELIADQCRESDDVREMIGRLAAILRNAENNAQELSAIKAAIHADRPQFPADQILAAEKARRAALRSSKAAS